MKKLFFLVVFIMWIPLFAQESSTKEVPKKSTLAVLNLTGKGADKSALSALTNIVIGEIAKSNKYELLDRANMKSILQEQGLQQTVGCTDEQCAVEMGQVLGVQEMLFGSLEKLGSTYILTLKQVDIETAKIVNIKSQQYKGEADGLIELTKILTNNLIGNVDSATFKKNMKKLELSSIEKDTVATEKKDTTVNRRTKKISSSENGIKKDVKIEKKNKFRQYVAVSYKHSSISDFTSPVYSKSHGWRLIKLSNIDSLSDSLLIKKSAFLDVFSKMPEDIGANTLKITGYLSNNIGFNFGLGGYSRSYLSALNNVKISEDINYIELGMKLNMYKRKLGPFLQFNYFHGVNNKFDVSTTHLNTSSISDTSSLYSFEPKMNGAEVEAGIEFYVWHVGIGLSYSYNWMGFKDFISSNSDSYLYIAKSLNSYVISDHKLDDPLLQNGYVLSGGSLNFYVNIVFGKNL